MTQGLLIEHRLPYSAFTALQWITSKIRGRSRLARQDVFVLRKTSSLDLSLTSGEANSASGDSNTALIIEQQILLADIRFSVETKRVLPAGGACRLHSALFKSQEVFLFYLRRLYT